MDDLHARLVRTLHIWRRIAPEEGKHGHPLVQADGNLVLDGEVEQQVHPERPGGECPHAADLFAEDRWRAELGLQDAKTAGITHSGDELRARDVRTHWSGNDWVLDSQCMTESGFHELLLGRTMPGIPWKVDD